MRRKNICKRSHEFRIELCNRIMQLEYYGFEVNEESVRKFVYIKRIFSLKFHTCERNRCKIKMFWCPSATYFDLETGEQKDVPLFFNISRAKNNDALFVYVQQNSLGDEIYPYQYVHKIDLKRIKRLMKEKKGVAAPSVPAVKMNVNCQNESVIRNALEYLEAIELTYRESK